MSASLSHHSEPSSFALRARALTKRYRRGRRPALDRVDLDVAPGSITALVGPNGAGKSTLIRCFLGFERPTGGFVTVAGIDPVRDRAGALACIGYVGQEPGLYRQLTADEHLALASNLRAGFDRLGAAARLDDLGIPRDAPVSELSGGQQAQVSLSLALGTLAPVLLMDEPVARLDPLARRAFLSTVRAAVREEARTVLMSSHIVGDLVGFCDRLVVLAPAAVTFHGTIEEATGGHAVIPAAEAAGTDSVVATFSDLTGRRVALVRRDGTGDASLDDVVLGYLAAAGGTGSPS
jgi:ABC-2 type transport system ATP-binding protein